MSQSQSLSLKTNPQFCIKFVEDPAKPFNYDTIICWIVLSKMMIVQNGEDEDEEDADSFFALHVYPNP